MNYTYRVRTDTIAHQARGFVTVYGVDVFDPRENAIVRSVSRLFLEKRCAEMLARTCNACQLHPAHLDSILDDTRCCFALKHL